MVQPIKPLPENGFDLIFDMIDLKNQEKIYALDFFQFMRGCYNYVTFNHEADQRLDYDLLFKNEK